MGFCAALLGIARMPGQTPAAQTLPKTDAGPAEQSLGSPNPAAPGQGSGADSGDATIKTSFQYVLLPVTVTDQNKNPISGLTPEDFALFDNGKQQRITEDVAAHPISLVIAVQANSTTEKILPQIQKIGSVIQALILGDTGEVAVVAFDHRIQVLTDFTSDPDQLNAALKKLKPGSMSSRLDDATMEGIRMLRGRPTTRRRVLLVIAENRDYGSQINKRDVLAAAEFGNVVVHSVNMSRLVASMTATPAPPRPDLTPPGGKPMPAGQINTSTTQAQMEMGNWVPVLKEIFKDAKNIFVPSPLTVYTRYTGGREYSFMSQRTLETAISDLGNEMHSQYLLTYSPSNQDEAGFHEIVVQVRKPGLTVRTKDGYYLAGGPPAK